LRIAGGSRSPVTSIRARRASIAAMSSSERLTSAAPRFSFTRSRGIAIETIARQYGLGFSPAQDEHYDFIRPKGRLARPAVQRFCAVLEDPVTQDALTALGFKI
jgi:hypothetical protein